MAFKPRKHAFTLVEIKENLPVVKALINGAAVADYARQLGRPTYHCQRDFFRVIRGIRGLVAEEFPEVLDYPISTGIVFYRNNKEFWNKVIVAVEQRN